MLAGPGLRALQGETATTGSGLGLELSNQLVQEFGRTGSLSLSGFYARRIRRLLPAALVAPPGKGCLLEALRPATSAARIAPNTTASAQAKRPCTPSLRSTLTGTSSAAKSSPDRCGRPEPNPDRRGPVGSECGLSGKPFGHPVER